MAITIEQHAHTWFFRFPFLFYFISFLLKVTNKLVNLIRGNNQRDSSIWWNNLFSFQYKTKKNKIINSFHISSIKHFFFPHPQDTVHIRNSGCYFSYLLHINIQPITWQHSLVPHRSQLLNDLLSILLCESLHESRTIINKK
jgi:hypothetical protein